MAVCSVCGRRVPSGMKIKLPGPEKAVVCTLCTRIYGDTYPSDLDEIKRAWEENDAKYARFQESAKYAITYNGVVHLDIENKWFYIQQTNMPEKPLLYDFTGLLGVEYKEVGGRVVSHYAGGFSGVALGALGLGSASGTTVTMSQPGTQYAIITVGNRYGAKSIKISQPKIAGITAFYKICTGEEFFDVNPTQPTPHGSQSSGQSAAKSITEEIDALKKLLDSGAITQEEFAIAKKKILGL